MRRVVNSWLDSARETKGPSRNRRLSAPASLNFSDTSTPAEVFTSALTDSRETIHCRQRTKKIILLEKLRPSTSLMGSGSNVETVSTGSSQQLTFTRFKRTAVESYSKEDKQMYSDLSTNSVLKPLNTLTDGWYDHGSLAPTEWVMQTVRSFLRSILPLPATCAASATANPGGDVYLHLAKSTTSELVLVFMNLKDADVVPFIEWSIQENGLVLDNNETESLADLKSIVDKYLGIESGSEE